MNKPGANTESNVQSKTGDDSDEEDLDVSKFDTKKKQKDLKDQRKKEIEALKAKGGD